MIECMRPSEPSSIDGGGKFSLLVVISASRPFRMTVHVGAYSDEYGGGVACGNLSERKWMLTEQYRPNSHVPFVSIYSFARNPHPLTYPKYIIGNHTRGQAQAPRDRRTPFPIPQEAQVRARTTGGDDAHRREAHPRGTHPRWEQEVPRVAARFR